jgi:hypothetical protein
LLTHSHSTLNAIEEEEEVKVTKKSGVASTNVGFFSPQVNLAQRQHIDLLGFKHKTIRPIILGVIIQSISIILDMWWIEQWEVDCGEFDKDETKESTADNKPY